MKRHKSLNRRTLGPLNVGTYVKTSILSRTKESKLVWKATTKRHGKGSKCTEDRMEYYSSLMLATEVSQGAAKVKYEEANKCQGLKESNIYGIGQKRDQVQTEANFEKH